MRGFNHGCDVTDLLRPEVVAGWCAWTARFEGRISWMYLDVRALVTCGLGCLLATPEEAQRLAWRHDGGELATAEAIRSEWWAVAAMLPGRPASYYREAGALHLTEDEIDRVALERLDRNAAVVARALPELADWPAEVQMLAMSHAWALGAGWPAKWPKLVAALRAGDWQAAANECRISEAGNPGVRARNDAVEGMLRGLVA